MADIQSAAGATSTPVAASGGQSGSVESASTERRQDADSATERAEPESATGPGVGEQVDIRA